MVDNFDEAVDYFDKVQRVRFYASLLDAFVGFVAATLPRWAKVLDVGCGPGVLTRKLARKAAEVVGIDSSGPMIDRAQHNARRQRMRNVTYVVGDVFDIPFEAHSFDLVVATSVLYLLDEPLAGLGEMVRVAKPGGVVAVLNPSVEMRTEKVLMYANRTGTTGFDFEALYGWLNAATTHNRFSVQEMRRLMERAGLTKIQVREQLDAMVVLAKGMKQMADN